MDEFFENRLPCGCTLRAQVIRDKDAQALAAKLGYGDARDMHAEHDPMHLKLAAALGLEESPSLFFAQHGSSPRAGTHEIRTAEEEMVLAAQRFLNLTRRWGLTTT